MDFKKVTDALFERVTHDDLAAEIGVSVALIRQSRLAQKSKAHRSPPQGWEAAALKLAGARVQHFQQLADKLRAPPE